MADIFISYSRKDSEQALQLAELLSSAGLSCWIDTQGIDVATSWSGEIVDAIDGCRAFILLLSGASVASDNVAKELALASERKKRILPIELEPVQLPREFAYQLAGIQRAPMTNIDSIIRALTKLGLHAIRDPQPPTIVKTDSDRKSIMILPFEDLSPTRDNDWFADGLASELISALSNVKSLRIIDWNTSKLFKERRVKTVDLARELEVRYFVEGQVRKFGDQIKISTSLLDIETGDHLWQHSLKGTMEDVFSIQEETAAKVLEGLKLHLTPEEQERLETKPTENAEAYELWLKGRDYYNQATRTGFENAFKLYDHAVRLDPRFGLARLSMGYAAVALATRYPDYRHMTEKALNIAKQVRSIEGETSEYCMLASAIATLEGRSEDAVRFAQRAVEIEPTKGVNYHVLARSLSGIGRLREGIVAHERMLELSANVGLNSWRAYLLDLHEEGSAPDRLRNAATKALPHFERHVRLNPDDRFSQVSLAVVNFWAGREQQALEQAEQLVRHKDLDPWVQYDLACLFMNLHQHERAIAVLRQAIEYGYRGLDIHTDPDLAPIRELPEFKELLRDLKQKLEHEQRISANV